MTFKVSKVSTYGLNQTATNNALSIQKQMAELQRQISTGVRSTTFEGYGFDARQVQRYRADLNSIESYINNIDVAQTSVSQMSRALTQLFDQMDIVIGQATTDPQEGIPDVETMQALARNAREIAIDVMNNKVGDRYLFAGSDVLNPPYNGYGNLSTKVQQEMSDWLNQTNTADQFMDNIRGLTQSQQGFSLSIQSAGNIRVRANDNFEVDYTIKANSQPFQDVIQALTVFCELEFPEEGVDLATREQYYEIQNEATTMLINAVDDLRAESFKLNNAEQALGKQRESLVDEQSAFLVLMEKTESIDPAEAIVKFQALQLQLEMSFQSTAIISQLSLSRML